MVNKITTPPTQNEVIDKINELVDGKQDTLVSGTNIKTVGGTSLLGSGNVAFPTVDQTYSASSTNAQSGVAVANAIAPKQDTLVSGTNIKTINGNSLLGSGNITIETSSTPNVDGETISYNANDALQTIAVKNVRDNSTLPIWHGTEYQWNHGDPTTWYYWQTSVTALWTSGGSLPNNATKVSYGDGRFVAIYSASKNTAYSTDGGATWTVGGSLPFQMNWCQPIYVGNRFVTVSDGSNVSIYSTDGGATWQYGEMPSSTSWKSIAYGEGKILAISYYGASAYSTDGGATWTAGGNLPTTSGFGNWNSIAYGDGRFVAVAYSLNKTAYSTDGGATWTAGGSLPLRKFNIGPIIYNNGKFMTIVSDNMFAYSTDGGATWTAGGNLPTTPSFFNEWRAFICEDGILLAIKYNSSDTAYSTDGGATWTNRGLPSSGYWESLAYGNNRFLAVKNVSTDSAIFSVTYDKCYTTDSVPTTASVVYSEPNVTSSYTISSVASGAITLSNNNTYYYNQSGNQYTYDTIGNTHPEYLCFIDGVGVKMGNTVIATNNSNNS